MKIYKTRHGEVIIGGAKIDEEKLADSIATKLAKLLGPQLASLGNVKTLRGADVIDNRSPIQIDETVIDVGVDMSGIEIKTDKPLAKETTKKDSVSKSVDKLKSTRKRKKRK